MDLYAPSNVCESLAVIGFAIEDVVLIDDGHADLLKLGFLHRGVLHYLDHEPSLCVGAEAVVLEVQPDVPRRAPRDREPPGQRCSHLHTDDAIWVNAYGKPTDVVTVDDARRGHRGRGNALLPPVHSHTPLLKSTVSVAHSL